MPFFWKHLIRQALRSVLGTRGTHRRLTGHRIGVLLTFWILFIPHQLFTRLCLLLDYVLFPGWHRTPVDKPLFITGCFRSGTTFLHRLMAGDTANFSAIRTWEIYLAPSITQRKLLRIWKRLDRLVGSPARRWLNWYDREKLGNVRFHKVGLWKEEEDEGLFLFLWDSLFTWFFFPDTAGITDYHFNDHAITPRRQRQRWRFYRACVRRHMYCHPGSPVYLSKNPAFTPQLASLREAFPDARVVYLVRDPRRVLVSQAAWFSFVWHYFASPVENYPFRDELYDMTRHWFSYPLERLDATDPADRRIIVYDDLIARPVDSIRSLYEHFGLPFREEFRTWLESEAARTDEYASGRKLTLEEVGYDRDIILSDFAAVYERFGFARD